MGGDGKHEPVRGWGLGMNWLDVDGPWKNASRDVWTAPVLRLPCIARALPSCEKPDDIPIQLLDQWYGCSAMMALPSLRASQATNRTLLSHY